MRHLLTALSLLSSAAVVGGCYQTHGLDGRPVVRRDAGGPTFDARSPRFDSAVPRRDAAPPRFDAAPPRFDAGRPGFDAGSAPDTGGGCVLPVIPYPTRDVCQPETGVCISGCGDFAPCIIGCLQRDDECRVCAVRNALSCFNSTPCVSLYPAISCCVVENCALTRIDEVLNVCTAVACESELTAYATCAVADSRERCRREVANCGLPPTLLGLDS